ncbi:MAG TPA: SDR family NAD(P)-dependent oxidoreductase [Solirubrobacterales bacterium]|nr:SDR family NAD(P)-dependent oxidoreductase [Solirubrobacterales bacterium]
MAGKRNPLLGKTVVVTGAASGIGRALAVRLSRAGSPVAIADADGEGLSETESLLAGPVLARELDVSDRQSMLAFAAAAAEWTPAPLGAVINNAGVATSQPFADAAVEDDEWVMNVNYGGVVNGSHAFLPLLLGQGSGTLVNVSSVFGLFGFPNHTAYCASKHAVRGFTEALRAELRGSGVAAAVVHPGGVKTNIVANSRFHVDDAGNRDRDVAAERFAALARTTPEKAARIIHRGIERGDPRIRIGADAVALDLMVRVAPVRYADLIEWFVRRTAR